MQRKHFGWRAVGAALAPLVYDGAVYAQCAMCKTGLMHSPEGQRMASGFNTGILFLLSVPFLVVGAFALLVARRRRNRGSDATPPVSESP